MKKNLSAFIARAGQSDSGILQGGFGSIRGGRSLYLADNTGTCTNPHTCTGTNSGTCTNSGDCGDATNSSPTMCTNSGTCLA